MDCNLFFGQSLLPGSKLKEGGHSLLPGAKLKEGGRLSSINMVTAGV